MNPYESPRLPSDAGLNDEGEPLVAWPATGAYSYYSTLVWHPASPLPRVCVRSGLPSDELMNFVLPPLLDDDGTLPPRLHHRGRKLYDVCLPVNRRASSFKTPRRIALLLLLGGILVALGSSLPLRSLGLPVPAALDPLVPVVSLLLCAVMVVSGMRLFVGPPSAFLLVVDRGYLQIGGLHPRFLAALPPWPVPDRDSAKP